MLKLNENVIEAGDVNARIMVIVITIENKVISFFSVYAPKCGCSTEKDLFDNLCRNAEST